MLGFIVGGTGFPMLHDLRQRRGDARHWSLHTKLTLTGTTVPLLGWGTTGLSTIVTKPSS